MAPCYSISGIGNVGLGPISPYCQFDNYLYNNGLYGGYGFNTTYGYQHPLSYTGATGTATPTDTTAALNQMYAMNPAMAMYNPLYMGSMQAIMEQNQLTHAGSMHTQLKNQQVQAHRETNDALIRTITSDSSVKQLTEELINELQHNKNLSGAVKAYNKLESQILQTYGKEIRERGTEETPKVAARNIACHLYSSISYGQTGKQANLFDDIEKYGDSAFMSGFMQAYKPGHHTMNVAEARNVIFGTAIDQQEHLENQETFGKYLGHPARYVKNMALGAASSAAVGTVCMGIPYTIFRLGGMETACAAGTASSKWAEGVNWLKRACFSGFSSEKATVGKFLKTQGKRFGLIGVLAGLGYSIYDSIKNS